MNIQIIRKKRKTLTIRINENGEVIVSCPLTYSNNDVYKILSKKQNWINNALKNVANKFCKNNEFYSYSKILLFGNEYKINIINNELYAENIKIATLKCNSNVKSLLKKWIYNKAYDYLNNFLKQVSCQIGIKYNKFTLISAKKKWGSCDNYGEIRLNYKLIMLKPECIRYVCVHELCHIKHLNHSNKFWSLVESFCLGYKGIRSEMKQNSFCLELFN